MSFVTFNGAFVANPVGHPPVAYLVRSDAAGQIAALDTKTPVAPDFAALRFHTFTGEAQERSSQKKVMRVKMFGEGVIPNFPGSAYMVVTVDNARSYVYPYSALSPVPAEGMLWNQNTHSIVGRTIDVTLYLTGAGIVVREMQVQYLLVN